VTPGNTRRDETVTDVADFALPDFFGRLTPSDSRWCVPVSSNQSASIYQ